MDYICWVLLDINDMCVCNMIEQQKINWGGREEKIKSRQSMNGQLTWVSQAKALVG